MFAKIKCAGLFGVRGFPAETEADSGAGLPGFYLTGALSSETKEAQYRVLTAIKNSGICLKPQKVTVNISPASRRKEGTAFDLSILIAVLLSQGGLSHCEFPMLSETFFREYAFLGELGLDGSLKPVNGVLPMTDALKACGLKGVVVPRENAGEASLIPGMTVLCAGSIRELLSLFRRDLTEMDLCRSFPQPGRTEETEKLDFSEIRGQDYLRRAAEIAVSGRHNILFSGAAGSGKTMIAKRIPTIMPGLSRDEEIELSKLYSICGLLPQTDPLIRKRPFRAPHHSCTVRALLGGGIPVRPGEASLASKGVLFLDELPLFRREAIEALREPLEERRIRVARLQGTYEFPADFALVGACNNCPCGFYPDRIRCRCTAAQIRMYQGRLSRPILERIDICAEARQISFEEIRGTETAERSETIRARVEAVYERQKRRFQNTDRTNWNSEMTPQEIERFCGLDEKTERFAGNVFRKKGLSARTFHKVLRVSRTIADMDGREEIRAEHIAEAVGLRTFEDRLWGGFEADHITAISGKRDV